ncbi:MAG: hypothetical protein K2I78_02340, partial [Clostridia bacterium]|nr:hypothetical protein [Clostridia bacterium]
MIEIKFFTNAEDFENYYMDIIRAFYPHVKIDDNGEDLTLLLKKSDDFSFCAVIEWQGKSVEYDYTLEKEFLEENDSQYRDIKYKAQVKRHSKAALYKFLSKIANADLPYGSLTGIRPTKLFHEVAAKGIDAEKYFLEV